MKRRLNKKVTCKDGFTMSVQANENAYCEPRCNNAEKYEAVEVGYPNAYEVILARYAEDKEDYTGTVYGWVPSQAIVDVIAKHGGIVSGELPSGIPYLKAS